MNEQLRRSTLILNNKINEAEVVRKTNSKSDLSKLGEHEILKANERIPFLSGGFDREESIEFYL